MWHRARREEENCRQDDGLLLLRFGRGELHAAEDAFAFFDDDDLIGLDVLEGFDKAAGPADFQELDGFGFADAEVDAQIVLGKIAAAATDFVDLGMKTFFAGEMGDAFDARADAAAIGFCADGFYFDPIVAGAGVAAQKLRVIVDGVDDDVKIAVVVEIAEGAAARGDGDGDARAGVIGNVAKVSVAQILVEELALRVAGLGFELLDFGIDVAVAD